MCILNFNLIKGSNVHVHIRQHIYADTDISVMGQYRPIISADQYIGGDLSTSQTTMIR